MQESQFSRTALATSLMRAIHTRLDRPRQIDDPWGDRLLLDSERAGFGSEARLRASPAYGMVILRTRYTEETLAAAVAKGVRQYVILGAGMDSFALRRPAFARDVMVIEVDHPASQAFKRERLHTCGVAIPPNLHFLAVDLGREALAKALSRSPYMPTEPAFFSWLGVAAYLTREANVATFRGIADCSVPDSEIVFTYLDERELEARPLSVEAVRTAVAGLGEPWVSGMNPTTLARELSPLGLRLLEDLSGDDIWRRYCAESEAALRSPTVRIARACVAG
jgi:methyltransferase (TIGR00027 family)